MFEVSSSSKILRSFNLSPNVGIPQPSLILLHFMFFLWLWTPSFLSLPFQIVTLFLFFFFNFFFQRLFIFGTERDRAWTGEGQSERETQNRKQAPGSEPSAQSPTRASNSQTARSWPGWSRMLNRLRHPSAPCTQLILNKRTKNITWGKGSLLNRWCPETLGTEKQRGQKNNVTPI